MIRHTLVVSGLLLAFFCIFESVGCGTNASNNNVTPTSSGNASSSAQASASQGASNNMISGTVTDGPVKGAKVTVYHVITGGLRGEPRAYCESYPLPPPQAISTQQVAADKSNYVLPIGDNRPMIVEAVGGIHKDYASGQTVKMAPSFRLRAVVPNPGQTPVHLTPFTTMAAYMALSYIRSGQPIAQAMTNANAAVARFLNLPDLISIAPVDPTDPPAGASQAAINYGLAIAALANEARDRNVELGSLTRAIGRDLEDGTLDGLSFGVPVLVQTGNTSSPQISVDAATSASPSPPPCGTAAPDTTPLWSTALGNDLNKGAQEFQTSGMSQIPLVALTVNNMTIFEQAPAFYHSPYSLVLPLAGLSPNILTPDYAQAPRNQIANEGSTNAKEPDCQKWYDLSAYSPTPSPLPSPEPTPNEPFPASFGPWPLAIQAGATIGGYPVPLPGATPPSGFEFPSTFPSDLNYQEEWMRERIVATARMFLGYNYQHHHIPDWNPTGLTNWPWSEVSFPENTAGMDCSDSTGFYYNFALGIHLQTSPPGQSEQATAEDTSGNTHNITTVLCTTGDPATDLHNMLTTLKPGDLLYIRGNPSDPTCNGSTTSCSQTPSGAACGNVAHVIMWLGYLGYNPHGEPLILDTHDNQPLVFDANANLVPSGVHIRPIVNNMLVTINGVKVIPPYDPNDASQITTWYIAAFDHANRIISVPAP